MSKIILWSFKISQLSLSDHDSGTRSNSRPSAELYFMFGDLPQLWLATGTKLNHLKFANASQSAVN